MLFFHEGTIIKSKESFFNNSKANQINSQKETITKGEEQPNCLFLYTYDFLTDNNTLIKISLGPMQWRSPAKSLSSVKEVIPTLLPCYCSPPK